jgi:hypothetical protein
MAAETGSIDYSISFDFKHRKAAPIEATAF